MSERLKLQGIVKSFGSFRANDNVDLSVAKGEVHSVLGENGAGKSTLMNIIYGLYQPDTGEIFSNGAKVKIANPGRAMELGIGMVHQHFKQVDVMSGLENIVLGLGRFGRLNLDRHRAAINALASGLGFVIDLDQPVWQMPVGVQQRVEILKLLYRQADLLILDEPTSVLTPNEVGPFFELLRRLKARGSTIILITHKLAEVMDISDRVTVMRSGTVVASRRRGETTQAELARLMLGRDVVVDIRRTRSPGDRPVLEIRDMTVLDDRRLRAVNNLSLTLRKGEILGVAGVDGNGQSELAEAITGLRPVRSGAVMLDGQDITHLSGESRKADFRVSFVPEDRQRTGLDLDATIAINTVLRSYRKRPFSKWGWLDFKAIEKHAGRLTERYDVRMRSIFQKARDLSGGNQQKIILAREIEADPDLLVVSQATKGLDVGAIEFVQKTLLSQRERGTAILYISTELEELLQIADRVAVIFKGRIVGEMDVAEATAERIGLLMAGSGI